MFNITDGNNNVSRDKPVEHIGPRKVENFDVNRFYPKLHSVEIARLATRTAIARAP